MRISDWSSDVCSSDLPTSEMISAFNEVLASQRRLEAAQNDGEAEKIKRTKSAEASAAAMTITAGGIAESRGIIAEGNAKALAAFRAETTLTDADAKSGRAHV